MRSGTVAVAVVGLTMLAGCGTPPARPVEAFPGGQDVSRFRLMSLQGTRDGNRLGARAVYGDGTGELRVDLRFTVGVPTRLESGTWKGLGSEGRVRERSVTFLGGQSGPPSIGGRFDLLGPDDQARYRVTIPVQPLNHPL
jgi:hypothetical protein